MNKQVIVVGAGPGGLAAAMQLSTAGYQVKVLEKQPQIGGRTSKLTVGDYHFDLGPTFFMMPQILEEVFVRSGRNLHDYVDMQEVNPLYTLKFGEVSFSPSTDSEKTKEDIGRLFPGNEEGYERFLRIEGEKFDRVIALLKQPFTSIGDFFTKDMWRALPRLNAFDTVYKRLSKYFSDERLKWAFSFQAKYLGMSAWDCPGTFTILSFLEHRYGLFHPIGGVNQVCHAMAKVIKENGGDILTNTNVEQVLVNKGEAVGVQLDDGSVLRANDVIINADFGYAMTHLFDQKVLRKYKKERLKKKGLSLSTFMLYLGVDGELDLPHHMVLFANDYKQNVDDITKYGRISEDPSIYVHNPSRLDPTLAPEGKSSLYVLMPVPNLEAAINWEEQKPLIREQILERLEREPGLVDIRDRIEVEKIVSPLEWEKNYNVYRGATFNLSHTLDQMMYFRPHNKFEDVEHCFLVGGGTHPGSGLPTIFQSAIISADLLQQQYDLKDVVSFDEEVAAVKEHF
ncbi:All-trans-zeta-carotene desaturase [Paraliobacillus sp. PM-2]|uniref:phytoene desaturase family protein n=1 Tax=Paraliobacillus sp. PM-2 TaxID=1462524 RepID=UPI00061C09D3|nr:phytoene desaturase family protein [Paraliobacillus sp. PM-2]CQR48393.1 All-trans-zeta-carotene desaturase [Paraliobacillus sp. PM-2]